MLVAILAALVTGIASGISKIRAAARIEDAADHAAWLLRIREQADALTRLEARQAEFEAEAKEFYGLLPQARRRAAEFEAGVAANNRRIDDLAGRLAELEGGKRG